MRKKIFERVKSAYGAEAEYPWIKYPTYAVLRSPKNKKWFAVVMSVSEKSLGLNGDKAREVMNVKCSPATLSTLRGVDGFLPAYHMNKEHWLSVLLYADVPQSLIFALIDESFNLINKTK